MKFKGAVFDLDGTLLDSMEVWKNIDIEFLSKRGLEVPKGYSDEILAMSFRETAEYTIARFGLQEQPDDVMHEWNQMAIEAYGHHVQLKPGAKEYLLKIKSHGIRLGVCTALSQKLYLPCLQNNNIYELFDACISTDDVSRGKIIPTLGYCVRHVWEFLLKTVWRLRMFFLQYKEQKQHI
ncbi:MAG: HAD family hydrolase [Acutalibacteraceae bacterium]